MRIKEQFQAFHFNTLSGKQQNGQTHSNNLSAAVGLAIKGLNIFHFENCQKAPSPGGADCNARNRFTRSGNILLFFFFFQSC